MENEVMISIITPVFNAADTIEDTLNSIYIQKFPSYELIVLDGGSTDGTVDIIRKYESIITYWRSHADRGHIFAMNEGMQMADGKFIYVLNGDDFLADENVLQEIGMIIEKNPDIDVVAGAVKILYPQPAYSYKKFVPLTRKNHRRDKQTPHQGAFIRRKAYEDLGYLNTAWRGAMDFEFFCRIANGEYKVYNYDRIIAFFRSGGISQDKTISWNEDAQIIRKQFGFWSFLPFWLKVKVKLFLRAIAKKFGVFQWYHKVLQWKYSKK